MIWARFCQAVAGLFFACSVVFVAGAIYAAVVRGDVWIGLMVMIAAVFSGALAQGFLHVARR